MCDSAACAAALFRDIERNRDAIVRLLEQSLLQRVSDAPSASCMAEIFCVSKRTFSRKLKAMGLSYRGLLDDVKSRLAKLYLHGSNESITTIAANLGYSDPSNFTKAFRGWEGCSPRQYRLRNGLNKTR